MPLASGDGRVSSLTMQYIDIFLLCGIAVWCFISTTFVTAFVPHYEHNTYAKNPTQQVIVCNKAVLFAITTDDIVIQDSDKAQDDR